MNKMKWYVQVIIRYLKLKECAEICKACVENERKCLSCNEFQNRYL